MKPISTLSLLALATSTLAAQAQDFTVEASRTSGVEYHISNYGIFGHNVASGQPGFEYPRGSNNHYVYGSGLWFGATKMVDDTLRQLVFLTYDPNSGNSWATPGNVDAQNSDAYLYNSLDYDRRTGLNTGGGTGPVWPLWLLPGQTASTRDAGTYEPRYIMRNTGTYAAPAFTPLVDEQFVARYNDSDLTRYAGFGEEFGFPLGLQIQQNVLSWQQGFYESVVVLQYEVVNISDDTLMNCVMGQATDPDLGQAVNDHVSVFRWIDGGARAAVTFTDAEGSRSYGALAQILLEGPTTGDDGFIDNSLRADRLIGHQIATVQNWPLEEDPKTNAERYHWMTADELDEDNGAGDKRTMVATRKFSMMPGDTAYFTLAFAVVPSPFGAAKGGDKGQPTIQSSNAGQQALNDMIGQLLGDYQSGVYNSFATSAAENVESHAGAMSIHPNPATDRATISFSLASPADASVSIVNAMGERVAVKNLGRVEAGAHRASIDIGDLATGSYLVVVDAAAERLTSKLTVAR